MPGRCVGERGWDGEPGVALDPGGRRERGDPPACGEEDGDDDERNGCNESEGDDKKDGGRGGDGAPGLDKVDVHGEQGQEAVGRPHGLADRGGRDAGSRTDKLEGLDDGDGERELFVREKERSHDKERVKDDV